MRKSRSTPALARLAEHVPPQKPHNPHVGYFLLHGGNFRRRVPPRPILKPRYAAKAKRRIRFIDL